LDKSELKAKGWLKISDLAKKAGVSVSTIHFYVREGLLTPPAMTSRNMAYYDPECVDEIRVIHDLRETRHLPLSAIKMMIHASREGQGESHLGEMLSFFERLYLPVSEKAPPVPLKLAETLENSGLEPDVLKELEEAGLIVPCQTGQGAVYDDIDLSIASIYKKLAVFGVKPRDLKLYRSYSNFLRTEARYWHKMFHARPDHEGISLVDFFQTMRDLKDGLALRVYRQEYTQAHAMPSQTVRPHTTRLHKKRHQAGPGQAISSLHAAESKSGE
jgi:DNA-binding transcriptional MerR regulator